MSANINKSADYILSKLSPAFSADIAVILGSGLGAFIKKVEILNSIPFYEIPFFKEPSVDGHKGKLVHAKYKSKEILILQGRVHYYEGYPMDTITYPIRVLKFLGIRKLILTNAAGGMNPDFSVGDIMIIRDHINLMPNPLIGKHLPEFGERFPDMGEAYNKQFIEFAENLALSLKLDIKKGVYIGTTGPTYETPAEYNYFRIIGGDAVGMSTVPEVIVARQTGIKCLGLSIITDLGVQGKIEHVTHAKVKKAAAHAEPRMAALMLSFIEKS